MEQETFISIIKEHRNLIYKICLTYCKDPENRKDLEQEVLIQLWNSFKKFDGRVKLTTWMYRIALNTAISYYRSDSRQRKRLVSLDTTIITLTQTEYDTQTEEHLSTVYSFFNRLNDMDKALIILYLDDNKYKDIADILGISETNVATKISRIKQTLKLQCINNKKNNNYGIR